MTHCTKIDTSDKSDLYSSCPANAGRACSRCRELLIPWRGLAEGQPLHIPAVFGQMGLRAPLASSWGIAAQTPAAGRPLNPEMPD